MESLLFRPLRRLLGRETSKEKTIRGYRFNIDIGPLEDVNDTRPLHRVDAAVQIPSNDQNLLLLDLAKEVGAVPVDYICGIGNDPIMLQWKRRDRGPDNGSYICKALFVIREGLPCGVIFGKHDPHKMHPGYPSPFEGASKQDFDESYDFSRPRTNSWAKTMMVARKARKSLSWGSDISKTKSQKSPSNPRISPMTPAANNSNPKKPNRTTSEDNIGSLQAVSGNMIISNAASFPTGYRQSCHGTAAAGGKLGASVVNRNGQPAAEKSTKLATIPSNGSAELGEENISLDSQNPTARGDSVAPPQVTESQIESPPVGLGCNSDSANATFHRLGISKTPEIASMQWRGTGDELQQQSLVSPISPNIEVEGVVMNTPSDSSAEVDSCVFVEPARSLPINASISQDRQLFSRKAEKNEAEAEAAIGTVHDERESREASNLLASMKKNENVEREDLKKSNPVQKAGELERGIPFHRLMFKYRESAEKKCSRKSRPHLRESDDSAVAVPEPEARQIDIQPKPVEPSRTTTLQSTGSGSREGTVSRAGPKPSKLEPENEPDREIPTRLAELSSVLKAGNVSIKSQRQPLKDHSSLEDRKSLIERENGKTTEDSETEALYLTTAQSSSLLVPGPSYASIERSMSTVHATERHLGHDETTLCARETHFKSGENIAEVKSAVPEVNQDSERLSKTRKSRCKPHIQRRGKAPRIRRAKGDAAQKADLTPAPGADKYWEYDAELNAYYHIDSDTGSTFWYEDSSDESEE